MADDGSRFVCECFFTHNIFVKEYEAHVVFENDEQFTKHFKKALYDRGCTSEDQWKNLMLKAAQTLTDMVLGPHKSLSGDVVTMMSKIKQEVGRRKHLGEQSQQRKRLIAEKYTPLYPQLYQFQESFLSESFLKIVEYAKSEDPNAAGLISMMEEVCKGLQIYKFSVFTQEFCTQLIEELSHFEVCDLPRGRPNTMNDYGVLLDELGFDEQFITPLRIEYLQPIATLLYPEWGGDSLDSHKAFTVQYKVGDDIELSYHYDNAEVTLNVCLGKHFTGGQLFFGGMRRVPLRETECTEVDHMPSYGLIHRGQHMHGALPTTHGERYNLIIWMRSSAVRNKLCPMCDRRPRLVSTTGSGDGFSSDAVSVQLCATL